MWSDELIELDKITKVSENFYEGIQRKMSLSGDVSLSGNVQFKRRHLWLSIAAGILLGLLLSGVHQQKIGHSRQEAIENLAGRYHMNDMAMEDIEKELFN